MQPINLLPRFCSGLLRVAHLQDRIAIQPAQLGEQRKQDLLLSGHGGLVFFLRRRRQRFDEREQLLAFGVCFGAGVEDGQ